MRIRYTEEQIVEEFKKFIDKNGRVPSAYDLECSLSLPSSRTFDRKFGGILAFKEKHGFGGDLRKSKERSELVSKLFDNSYIYENEVHNFLADKFTKIRVHRQDKINEQTNHRCDFRVYRETGDELIIDTFNPSNIRSFTGCLNIKLKKYKGFKGTFYFVCINSEISQSRIDELMNNKKNKLDPSRRVMSLERFKQFISVLY